MTKIEIVLVTVGLLVLAATIYFARATAHSVAGEILIPTKSDFSFFLPEDAADASLLLHAEKVIPAGSNLVLDMRSGVLSEQPEQTAARKTAGLSATVERNRGLARATGFPFGDWGTFAAVRTGPSAPGINDAGTDSGRFVYGLRVSPVRLLYGTVAPDLLLAVHSAGLGVSMFPPADIWGHQFAHWGIGVGRLFSLANGGSASTVAFLSFSTWDH